MMIVSLYKIAECYTLELYVTLGDFLLPITSPPQLSPPQKPTRTYSLPSTHLPAPHGLVSTLTSHALLMHLHSPGTNKQTLNRHNTTAYPLILTTGDPRHPSLLLHSSSPEKAAHRPLASPQALEGIPGISHLVADPGGWYIAAVAAPEHGGTVYLWGGQAGKSSKQGLKGAVMRNGDFDWRRVHWEANEGDQEQDYDGKGKGGNVKEGQEQEEEEDVVIVIPPHESQPPVRCDDDDGEQEDATLVDFALGAGHLLTLLDCGEVFGLGRCDEGQLGPFLTADDSCLSVGQQDQEQNQQQWVTVTLPREIGARMVVQRIWAGGWESWMLVDMEEGLS